MNFRGTAEAEEVRQRLATFVADELLPLEARHGIGYEGAHPKAVLQEVWAKSYAKGFLGLALPREFGGLQLSVLDLCLIKSDLYRSGAALAPHVIGDFSGPPRVGTLLKRATPDQMERYFMQIARGQKSICFAMTEPETGSDLRKIQTTAVRQGDHYVLNGHKHYITGGAYADVAIVIAYTDRAKGLDGLTALLVDLDSPGVRVSVDYVPMHGQRLDADIHFEKVRVPVENRLGEEGEGFRLGIGRINLNRLLHCPTMIGLASRVFEDSVEYAKNRVQGDGPIARFQAIRHMLANMGSALFACEGMVIRAAIMADQGVDIRREAAMCKLFVSERAFEVADQAVQIHGNVGVTKGHRVEWTFRYLRMFRVFTGTSEIQRNTIAQSIIGD